MARHKVGRPPSEHTTRNLSVRFTEDEREALEAHAAARDVKLAVLIREVLEKAGLLAMPARKRGG